MMKIYTPKEWMSFFRGCPSLIIDDKGLIWAGDEYYKILFGEPSGKVDFEKGYIYGEDYAKLMAVPIGILEKVNDAIKVYDYRKGRFSAPLLYIQDDKIYTPEQWTSIFDIPGGYIEKEHSGEGESGFGRSSGGMSDSGSSPMSAFVFAELGVVIVVLILAVSSIQSLMHSAPGMLAYLISVFLIAVLVGRHNREHNPFLTRLSDYSGSMIAERVMLCKKNAMFWALLCCAIPFVCGIWMVMEGGQWTFMIFLITMLILGWASYLSFRNAILRGDLKCWPFTRVSSPQSAAAPETVSPTNEWKSSLPADIQAEEIAEIRVHPYSCFIAEKIAAEWVPGGKMYEILSDPTLMVNRMTLVVSNYYARFNVECDDSTTKLYEVLPQNVWEKEYDFTAFGQMADLNCSGFAVPLTDSQRFGIHERIRDELEKLPYYTASHGKGTQALREIQTGEIYFMYTEFRITF